MLYLFSNDIKRDFLWVNAETQKLKGLNKCLTLHIYGHYFKDISPGLWCLGFTSRVGVVANN